MTRSQVDAVGLSSVVNFVHARLVPQGQSALATVSSQTYDVSLLPDCRVDVALVDGPPSHGMEMARFAPLQWAAEHLPENGAIFLDDAGRSEERRCLGELIKQFPKLLEIEREAEKGLVEVRAREV